MRKVLIVDDEEPFLLSLKDGLEDFSAQFELLTAANGRAAVELLEQHEIDLVVTDLKMPEMSGFELLAHMSRQHPSIPVVVMTAHGTPETERSLGKLGAARYLEKPIDLATLLSVILDTLEQERPSFVRGFSLATFLQLIEMDRRSCTLRVSTGAHSGYLHFSAGKLVGARTAETPGNAAALQILGWDETSIEILDLLDAVREITAPLQHLLLEAYRLKDEEGRPGSIRKPSSLVPPPRDQTPGSGGGGSRLESAKPAAMRTEDKMALEKHLAELKEIKGYRASGILNFTGEVLAGDSLDSNVDLPYLGATFNDIFRTAHAACEKIGLEACREATFVAPNGIVLMRCSGTKSRVHFHLISVVAADGNQALTKMKMERMVGPVMDELG